MFGISTPAAKALVGTVDPIRLAGLLYCGAGIGVAALRRLAPAVVATGGTGRPLGGRFPVARRRDCGRRHRGAYPADDRPCPDRRGDRVAPARDSRRRGDRAHGVVHVPRKFRSQNSPRHDVLVAGAAAIAWTGAPTLANLIGPAAIVGACVVWGLDNNLTRKVSLADPLQIVELKGLVAGPFNLALGLSAGAALPDRSMRCGRPCRFHRLRRQPRLVRGRAPTSRYRANRRLLLDRTVPRRDRRGRRARRPGHRSAARSGRAMGLRSVAAPDRAPRARACPRAARARASARARRTPPAWPRSGRPGGRTAYPRTDIVG